MEIVGILLDCVFGNGYRVTRLGIFGEYRATISLFIALINGI